MHSRAKNKSYHSRRSRRNSFQLEQLESRLLMNAASEWADKLSEGYGIADPFYADPIYTGVFVDNLEAIHPEERGNNRVVQLEDIYPESAAAKPTSILYLDFNGERVYSRSGDFWLGDDYVDVPAFSLTRFGWGGREQEAITHIIEFVREDYAAYNIQVTTTKPSSGEYTTMYVGGESDWFQPNSSVIGVATYDIGNKDASNYGFAFTDELGIYKDYSGGSLRNFSEYIANLITHEAAHTFGANHVNDVTETMNPYLAISPRTTTFGYAPSQDTQTLLGVTVGYGHGADDFGNSVSGAYLLGSQLNISGLLERRDDTDAFKFTAAASGNMSIAITSSVYSNLDSYLTIIRNSDQMIIGQNDNYGGSEDPFISFNAIAGQQYILLVNSSGGNSSGSFSLDITTPITPPQLHITENSGVSNDRVINLGTVMIGQNASTSFTLNNLGGENLIVSQLSGPGDLILSPFSLAANNNDNLTVSPNQSQVINVNFTPSVPGSYTGTITIASNDSQQSTQTVTVTALVQESQADIAAGSDVLDFGSISRGSIVTQSLIIRNTGSEPLQISDILADAPFVITSGFSGTPLTIAPAGQQTLTISVSVAQRGSLSGSLTISSDDPDEPVINIDLAGIVVGGGIDSAGKLRHDQ